MADLKEQLLEVWKSRAFQITMDVCRILLIVIAVLILYTLIKNIDAVKVLNYDACRICENKTGALCRYIVEPYQSGLDVSGFNPFNLMP